MKIWKNQNPVYGHAFSRKEAIAKLGQYREEIAKHIAKCVVYRNTGDVIGWATEIGAWLVSAGKVKKASGGAKFDTSTYAYEVFRNLGHDDRDDAEIVLIDIWTLARRGKYPRFEITPELLDDYTFVANYIVDHSVPYLADKEYHTRGEYSRIVTDALALLD